MTFLILSCSFCYGQNTIHGQVIDETDNQPVIGATVVIKDTNVGTTTDIDGMFTIKVNNGQVLTISYIGLQSQNITIKNGNDLNVKLAKSAINLDEIVVVGYGTTRKRDITGAITSLKTDDIKAGVVTNAAQLIKGRAAGVLVRQNSNEPGGGISIRIRGASSVSSNNEPLYVIDGFQTSIGNQINPEDVESIEILKDAAATSIYGARGANGVVIITTKKGKEGHFNISYSYNISIKKLNNPWDLMDAQESINYAMDSWRENGSVGNAPYTEKQLEYKGAGTDWIKEATQTAQTQQHQLSVTGGSSKLSMAISANYTDDMGILKNTEFNRFSSRMNMGYKLNEKVRFGTNVYLSRARKNYLNMGTNVATDNIMYNLFIQSPLVTPSGKTVFGEDGRKPAILNELNDVDFESVTNSMYATLFGEVDILKNLTARMQYTYGNDNTKAQKYYPKTTNVGKANEGQAIIQSAKSDQHQLDALLTYNQQLGKLHHLKFILGGTYTNYVSESSGMQACGFSTDEFKYNNIGAGKRIDFVSSGKDKHTTSSFFAKGEYILNDKYILNASIRADGASNFGPNQKWGYFPSTSLAWQLSEEPFMSFAKSIFSNIKLRSSFGITGNDGIGNYLSQVKFAMGDVYLGGNQIVKGMFPSNPGNKDLKWETTRQLDFGIDFTLFNNRIEVNFDHYIKITEDLLNPISVSTSTGGFETFMGNNGKIENKGFELFIKSNNISTKNFSWVTSFNASCNKNKVVSLNKGEARYEKVSPHGWYEYEEYALLQEGKALSSLYGYVFDGIIQNGETYAAQPNSIPGDPKFVDIDKDGTVTSKDRTVIGDGNPDIIWGLNNQFKYKDFDFSFFFDSALGGQMLNLSRIVLEDENRLSDSRDRWTQNHPSNSIPRNGYKKNAGVKYGSYINSRFVESASYVRLQNIELGYNLPVNKIKNLKKHLKSLRLFIGGQNLFTITKYSGFDPEASANGGSAVSQGLDFSSYPAYRTFNAGVKIIF